MTKFDIICVLLVVLFVLRCSLRGFVKEFMSMAAIALGLLAGAFFYKDAAVFIRERLLPDHAVAPEILGFIVLFVIMFVVVRVVCSIVKEVLDQMHMDGVDRFLGALFGIVEGLAAVSLLLFVINIQPLIDQEKLIGNSIFAEHLLPLVSRITLPF
jgi:membrane protein required for colicin V production